jgi:hypothetical protein
VKLTIHLHLVPRSKNAWSCTSTPLVRLHGVVLSLIREHGDSFTFLPLHIQFLQVNMNNYYLVIANMAMMRNFEFISKFLLVEATHITG